MKKENLASGLWLLFSVCAGIESLRLGLGAGHRPGAGFFPFAAALCVGMLALGRLFDSFRAAPPNGQMAAEAKMEGKKIFWIVAGLLSYAYFLEQAGFLLCTFVLMMLYLKVVAGRSWAVTLAFAFAVSMGAQLFFTVALRAQLPAGFLNF